LLKLHSRIRVLERRLARARRASRREFAAAAPLSRKEQRALRRGHRRYRQVLRFAACGMFGLRPDRGWTFANRFLGELLGRKPGELLGEGWLNAVHPEDRARVAAAYRTACRSTTPLAIEFRIRPARDADPLATGAADPHETGDAAASEARWVSLQIAAQPHRREWLGIVEEITQRKRAAHELQRLQVEFESRVNDRTLLLMRANQILQEQIFERRRAVDLLEESEERWRSLVQNAADTILHVNRDRTIGFINHTHLRPDLGRAGVIGQSVFAFIFPEYHAQVERDLNRVFEHGETLTNEVEAPTAQGERRWFQCQISPIERSGRVTGATVVCRDITEFKRAAEQLRQTQERLIHLARVTSVGEMAAAVAHELNQPLAAVANYVRGCMLRMEADQRVGPEILHALQEAVDEAHRASEVIRRLRQFLQRHERQCERISLNNVVQDAVRLAEPACRRLGASLVLQLEDELPMLLADRVQLIQVLLNLLLNAAEAMSQVTDAPRLVTIETLADGPHAVAVAVRDRGLGVPPELGQSIFHAFVTTKPEGLGMGLSISRTIVEAHGGTLRFEHVTTPRGTRFVAAFPTEHKRTPK
jgi:two-component system sensor histidine kinase DctS/two-component system sensor kinase FixL